ncbi:MAG: TIGR03905 family TSCPD domain-containing protein [Clostridia bacterium]|nr:TIGR03905 family TSCPD domain-containing protein [Clostridia bacterium]
MTKHEYKTSGTCSRKIIFELDDDGKVHNVVFEGGCHGNLQGIGKLVEGMDAADVIKRVEGIKCGFKQTSCPDQLSKALSEAVK